MKTLYIATILNDGEFYAEMIGTYYTKEEAIEACRKADMDNPHLTFEKEGVNDYGRHYWLEWSGYDTYRIYDIPLKPNE